MLSHGAYNVSIEANGIPLQEYATDEGHGQSADKVAYVEAIEGSQFLIRTSIEHHTPFPTGSKAIRAYIDGRRITAEIVNLNDKPRGSRVFGWERVTDATYHCVDSQWMQQSLQFSKILTTEEKGDFKAAKEWAKNAGTIRIEIYNVTTETVPLTTSQPFISESIPEKALKGRPVDMSIGFGPAVLDTSSVLCMRSKNVGKCLASFAFLYRSRRSLQLLDIIPTTPEPAALEDQDPNLLSLEDARKLVLQYQAKERNTATVKKENTKVKTEENHDSKTPRKRSYTYQDEDECQIISVKKAKPTNDGEVVVLDLT